MRSVLSDGEEGRSDVFVVVMGDDGDSGWWG